MSYGRINRGLVVVDLSHEEIEEIDLTGEDNGILSINHEATVPSDVGISTSDAGRRASYERTTRRLVVVDLTIEDDEVISVSDEPTDMSDANTNTSDEGSVTSSEDINMSEENINVVSISDENIIASDVETDISDESSIASSQDTNMSDEDVEVSSVSDEADTDTDATSQDSNDDDYQPDEEAASTRHSTSVDITVDSWLDEWPDQSPSKIDLKVSHIEQRCTTALAKADIQQDIHQNWEPLKECLIPKLRHSQKFRDEEYGKASIFEILTVWTQVHPSERHWYLPSAFDHPRGRPYEIICERVWDSWHRSRRDGSMRDAIPSIERGGKRNWPNAGPAMLRFPEHRIRHKKRRRN